MAVKNRLAATKRNSVPRGEDKLNKIMREATAEKMEKSVREREREMEARDYTDKHWLFSIVADGNIVCIFLMLIL